MMPAASPLDALQYRNVEPEDYDMLLRLLQDVPKQEGIPAYFFKYLEREVAEGGSDCRVCALALDAGHSYFKLGCGCKAHAGC